LPAAGVSAVLMEISDEWEAGKAYLTFKSGELKPEGLRPNFTDEMLLYPGFSTSNSLFGAPNITVFYTW